MRAYLVLAFCCLSVWANGQTEFAFLQGEVRDLKSGVGLELAQIAVIGSNVGSNANSEGKFKLKVEANKDLKIEVRYLGYEPKIIEINLKPNQVKNQIIYLKFKNTELGVVNITDREGRADNTVRMNIKTAKSVVNATGGIEKALIVLGANPTGGELSNQYSVRGGNYDENLVYVNDIEVYRPQLARQGQQEGLSFINPDMVQSIEFSTGGFQAKYGDKLSSVLDIKYRNPTEIHSGINASFLGGSVFTEGVTKKKKFSWIIGSRYRTLSSLLNTLDTQGEYRPSATDFQSYFRYVPNDKWEFGFLGNYNRNQLLVVPVTRTTSFGTISTALALQVFFDGKEVTNFQTLTFGATATYRPTNRLTYKLIASTYQSNEQENFDVQGAYLLGVKNNDLGSEDFGSILFYIGAGGFHDYGRNRLYANVYNLEHKGSFESGYGFWRWGAKAEHNIIEDRLFEWSQTDSAEFVIPVQGDTTILMTSFVNAINRIESQRFQGFLQNTYTLNHARNFTITAGIRANHWTYTGQTTVSPRLQAAYQPLLTRDWILRFAAGHYAQQPFYREMRDLSGKVNTNIRAQQSLHFVLGSDLNFKIWSRNFRFVSELYYKSLYNLIPYEINNVRLRYYADKTSKGYATGVDFRVNGEFVKNLESFASLSLLKTREDIQGDFYIDTNGDQQEIGYVRRPTDQRVNFSIVFQDFLPKNPTYKVSLSLFYGGRLPYSPLNDFRFRNIFTIPPYRRVDIGFSKQLIGNGAKFKTNSGLKHFDSMWISLEVFNLLQIQNTISYIWVRDVSVGQFAVPNYLTNRQINFRLVIEI